MRFDAEVLQSRSETPTTHSIRVTRHADFEFRPVQFTMLTLATTQGPETYPMSLASSPTRDHLEYGVRLSETPWKKAFAALKPGDTVTVQGPKGHFILDEKRDAVLIAGGIGITPLKGMAEYAHDRELPIGVTLVYSNRNRDEIAFRDALEALTQGNPRFRIVHTLTRQPQDSPWEGRRGRIDQHLLQATLRDHPEAAFYVCGTPGMVEDLTGILANLDVPESRILYEEFWGY